MAVAVASQDTSHCMLSAADIYRRLMLKVDWVKSRLRSRLGARWRKLGRNAQGLGMYGDLQGLIGAALPQINMLELLPGDHIKDRRNKSASKKETQMKNIKRDVMLVALLAAGLTLTACTSNVKTYDGSGTLMGSCTASRGWFYFGGANCTGSANPKDQK